MEALQRGRGHDFYRIRPYEAFESARHVDWRATAHTGSLQVREFAREQDHRVVIYFDLDAPFELEAWFESAVDCAAFLAFRLAERGAHIRFQTQDYDVSSPGEADIYTILKYLALVSPRRGKPPAAPDDPGHLPWGRRSWPAEGKRSHFGSWCDGVWSMPQATSERPGCL